MSLVIAKAICQREFGAESVPEQFADVLRRSMVIDLATTIKGSNFRVYVQGLVINVMHPCKEQSRRGNQSLLRT